MEWRLVETPAEVDTVRVLFRAYAESMGYAICFESFEAELTALPHPYVPPGGCLLLARADGRPAGCVALQRLDAETGEIKRLYVDDAFRGQGLARSLTETVLTEARRIGYRRVRLETLPTMVAARTLYDTLHFHPIPAYRSGTDPQILCLERLLDRA